MYRKSLFKIIKILITITSFFINIMGNYCSEPGCTKEANTQCIDCGEYICTKHCFAGYCEKCYEKHGGNQRNTSEVCHIC